MTVAPGAGPIQLYALIDTRLEIGGGWRNHWAVGAGGELGMEASTPEDRFKAKLFARGTRFVAGDRESHLEAGLAGRMTLSVRTAAIADLTLRHFDGEEWLDASLSLQWTF
ncbi:MAG: hypothetical protein GY723_21945 [bacterium]|nr:hypothetical protein [bacterium]MCP5067172.1 hypothetical protein [bacterium]